MVGSSPLARGARFVPCWDHKVRGIIPACAGSTHVQLVAHLAEGDHPRLRGEHSALSSKAPAPLGSSPLARGAQHRKQGVSGTAGIIPACAGSTRSCPCARPRFRDHPRLRGEHRKGPRYEVVASGSSPLARGAPRASPDAAAAPGIIPACAGSTSRASARAWRFWDHPRLRGEHVI